MPHRPDPDRAPTPFTAEEIREGCPPGRTVVTRSTSPSGVEGLTVTVFRSHTDNGAHMTTQPLAADGRPTGDQTASSSTWVDLQGHASFLAADTTITQEALTTPMGRLDCLRYDVVRGEEIHRFWFAVSLPGMPVRVSIVGTDEVVVMEMLSSE